MCARVSVLFSCLRSGWEARPPLASKRAQQPEAEQGRSTDRVVSGRVRRKEGKEGRIEVRESPEGEHGAVGGAEQLWHLEQV